jgi:acyltransferase
MRLDYIDNAKAIAILLVIIGHTDGLPQFFKNLIFSFHMPAFFFISGYLVKQTKLDMDFISFAKSQINTLIIPYIFFGIISIIYSILNNIVKGSSYNIFAMLYGFAYGNSEGLVNISLWFFTCLFSTSIIYFLLSNFLQPLKIVFISLLLGFSVCLFHNYVPYRPPWNLELSLITLFFFSFGNFFRESSCKINSMKSNTMRATVFFCLAMSLCYLSIMNGRVDMAFMTFKNSFLFYINACIGIGMLLTLGTLIPITRSALFLSKNTIVLFPLHPIIFSMFTGLGMIVFKMPHSFQDAFIWSIIYASGAIMACCPLSFILFKYLPFTIGGRKNG